MYIKEYLHRIINSKSIINGIWLYILQFFNLVVPLLTLPYITRILGSESYGIFSIALNIITYLQVIVEYGFGMSATRKVAIEGRKNLNRTFTVVTLGRLILFLCCLCLAGLYIVVNWSNQSLCINFVILLICLLGYCVQMNWAFQGLQEMKYISIINVLGRLISTALIFIFVKSKDDIYIYSMLYSISPFLSGFLGLRIATNRYQLKIIKISLRDVIIELKEGFYFFTTQLSSKVFGTIGITFLGIYSTSSIVGAYSVIQKIPNTLILMWLPIAQIIYPMASARLNLEFVNGYIFIKRIRNLVMPFFFLLAFVIGVFAQKVVLILFGSEYATFYMWLYPLLAWLLVAIDNNFWGIQLLLGSGHDKEYGSAFNTSVIITIIMNFLLIYLFSGFGAAIAPLVSEIVLHILLRKKAVSIFKQKNSHKEYRKRQTLT